MPIWTRDLQPDSILRRAAIFGPATYVPVGDTAGICASQAMTQNVPLLLNGLASVNVGLGVMLPVPLEPVFTPAVNTDVFRLVFVGLDHYGIPLTVGQDHASGVVSQRMAANFLVNLPVLFSRIDSITPVTNVTTGTYVVTGNITVGWKFAQAADGGSAPNQQQRVPLLARGQKQGDLLGMYVLDGGGGTFAASNGQGVMLKSPLANFTVFPAAGAITAISYAANPSVLPTRPCTFIPIWKPGVNGNMSGTSGLI